MPETPTWKIIQGKWIEMKGLVQQQWGKLTNDDITEINGQREKLAGKLQQHYGYSMREANDKIDEWAEKLKY
jgi:uncharacterized protein YjbJ (UPF0337 family)